MRNNNRPIREKSKWYFVDNRIARLSAKISGLNLQGTGKTSGFFFAKELKTTVFMLQLSIFSFSWQCTRTFDEFKEFYLLLRRDDSLGPDRNSLNAPFPNGNEGDCDVMVLLERREMIEEFLQEVVSKIDFELYEPLNIFVHAKENMKRLLVKLDVIKRAFRKAVARKKLNLRLFKFYSKELLKFTYTMESGITVFDASCPAVIASSGSSSALYAEDRDSFSGLAHNLSTESLASVQGASPVEYVMWLDICEEMALSRLCVATREVFELPAQDYEDERLANGIFLSDIAEVRRGTATFGFKTSSAAWIKPAMCVSIVGSERTLDVQLASEERLERFFFIDMLNLLVLQSLSPNEARLRNKKYSKVSCNMHLKLYPSAQKMKAKDVQNALKMTELLSSGIEVDVETYSPYYGISIRQKLLKYNRTERKLYITSKLGDAQYSVDGGEEENDGESHPYDQDDSSSSDSDCSSYTNTESDHHEFGEVTHNTQSNAQQHSSSSNSIIALPGKNTSHLSAGGDLTTQNRCIDIDDVSEVRPGKISFCADGSDDTLALTIIASETIICLPVNSIKLRDNLVNRFQAFIQMHRDYESLDSDVPKVFRRKSSIAPLKKSYGSKKLRSGATAGGNSSTAAASVANGTSNATVKRPSHVSTVVTNSPAEVPHKKHSPRSHAAHKQKTRSAERRGSGGASHHHLSRKEQIYSHLLQVRSVSMVRSSTMSSRNSASISEFLGRSESHSAEP